MKLTVTQVFRIRELASQGCTDDELATEFNVTRACISQIRTGARRARVGGPRTFLEGERERKVVPFGGES